MRILVATDQWFPHVRGGVARVATETARRLASAGHDVTVVAPAGATEEGDGHGRLDLRAVVRRDLLPKTVADPPRIARACRRLANGPFDVLVGHTATDCLGLARSGIDAPLVYVFHASAVLEARFLAGRLGRRPRRLAASALIPLLERTERRALDAADRVLVLSEYSRSLLAGRRPDAAATAIRVQGGVDVERFSPGDRVAARRALDVPSEATLVVAVRRLVERMGLEELVEACATLGADRPLQLVIAGTGPLGPDLAARIRRSGAPARLVGRVGEEALVDWLRAADLVVMPSVAYEGFGLVTAEALACGTPVLGTPVGATPEILAPLDDVLLADGADAGSLSRGIERALAQAGTLRDRCREYALERLSWERAMPAWEAAICGVAGER